MYKQEHKEETAESWQRYYEENQESLKAKAKEYHKEHKEERNQNYKEWHHKTKANRVCICGGTYDYGLLSKRKRHYATPKHLQYLNALYEKLRG